jgi:hypothetical protein
VAGGVCQWPGLDNPALAWVKVNQTNGTGTIQQGPGSTGVNPPSGGLQPPPVKPPGQTSPESGGQLQEGASGSDLSTTTTAAEAETTTTTTATAAEATAEQTTQPPQKIVIIN